MYSQVCEEHEKVVKYTKRESGISECQSEDNQRANMFNWGTHCPAGWGWQASCMGQRQGQGQGSGQTAGVTAGPSPQNHSHSH